MVLSRPDFDGRLTEMLEAKGSILLAVLANERRQFLNLCKIRKMNQPFQKCADSLIPHPFAWTRYFLSQKKYFLSRQKFCSRVKRSYLLSKRIENDFLAVEKILS